MVLVIKPKMLARVVRHAIRHAGSQSQLAEHLGKIGKLRCGQRHLSRLAREVVPARIHLALRKSLATYLGQANMKNELGWLEAAVTDRKAAAFHRNVYRRWLDRAIGLGPPVKVVVPVGTGSSRRGIPPGTYWIRSGGGPTLEPLLTRLDARYTERLERFRKQHAHHDRDRVDLAIRRALNVPLIEDQGRSGGVELSARELHEKGVLDQYLRAALRREAILLQRSPDLQRVLEVMGRT